MSKFFLVNRFGIQFAMLLALLLVYPLIQSSRFGDVIADIVFSLVLLSGIYIAAGERKRKKLYAIALALAVPAFTVRWLEYLPIAWSARELFEDVFGIVFLVFTLAVIVSHLTRTESVTSDTIYGAMCAYLLVGLTFSLVYELIYRLDNRAFWVTESQLLSGGSPDFSLWVYFSFITLTTLGYGDVYPVLPWSRVICALEAIVGQLYVAVLIASLVGINAGSKHRSR